MKRLFAFLVIAILVFAVYWYFVKSGGNHHSGPAPVPIALQKHTSAFNMSVDSMVNAYLDIKDAFIARDTAIAKSATRNFIICISNIKMDELKNDTLVIQKSIEANLSDIRSNAESLLTQSDILEMREDFRMITEMMYPSFFKTINYEGPKLYLFNCENAFGEGKSANWISKSTEVKNPYSNNPASMQNGNLPNCGVIKDTIKAL